jgi:hypothetical protein
MPTVHVCGIDEYVSESLALENGVKLPSSMEANTYTDEVGEVVAEENAVIPASDGMLESLTITGAEEN